MRMHRHVAPQISRGLIVGADLDVELYESQESLVLVGLMSLIQVLPTVERQPWNESRKTELGEEVSSGYDTIPECFAK